LFWDTRGLPAIGFPAADVQPAFGFVHPDYIVRACHLIPGFRYFRTSDCETEQRPLGPSIVRRLPDDAEDDADYYVYYVNM
jgi:hypothetical protein